MDSTTEGLSVPVLNRAELSRTGVAFVALLIAIFSMGMGATGAAVGKFHAPRQLGTQEASGERARIGATTPDRNNSPPADTFAPPMIRSLVERPEILASTGLASHPIDGPETDRAAIERIRKVE